MGNIEERPVVAALEGNIGAGKTTFCKGLKDDARIRTYTEKINDRFLTLFYEDPKQYGFAFQMRMICSRIFQWRLAMLQAESGSARLSLWDRSMLGDYMFATWNYLQGSISNAEMKAYENEFKGSLNNFSELDFVKQMDVVVFLECPPAHCHARCMERGTAAEKNIPLSYFEGIDDIQFHFLVETCTKTKTPVLVLTTDMYHDSHASHVGTIEAVGRKERRSAQLRLLGSDGYMETDLFLFDSPEAVNAFVARNFTMPSGEPIQAKSVALPAHKMVVKDPWALDKIKVSFDDLLYKDIVFYEPNLRRVTYWLLSRGFNVILA